MATNVPTCESLGSVIIRWLAEENADPSSNTIETIRRLLKMSNVKIGFKAKTDSTSPTGKRYYITITQTGNDGEETTEEYPLDALVNDIVAIDRYVTSGNVNYNFDANGATTETKIILHRSNGLSDILIPLQPLINNIKADIKNNQDKYVNGGTLTITNDNNGNPTGGKITLQVKNGDPVEIDLDDLLDALTGYSDDSDKYLTGVDKFIKQGANDRFESIQLKFNVKGKDPILVDLTDLVDAQIEARRVILTRYYPTIMFNQGKIDDCTKLSTERIGWVYHKDDLRPADADVEIIDESTPYNILGYAYGTSTPDHNIPIQYTEPDGDVVTVGYAANAPLMLVEE